MRGTAAGSAAAAQAGPPCARRGGGSGAVDRGWAKSRCGDAASPLPSLLPAAPEGRLLQPCVEARPSRPGDTRGSRCRGQGRSPAAPGVTARGRACVQSPDGAPCRRLAPRRLSRDSAAFPASSPRGRRSRGRAGALRATGRGRAGQRRSPEVLLREHLAGKSLGRSLGTGRLLSRFESLLSLPIQQFPVVLSFFLFQMLA